MKVEAAINPEKLFLILRLLICLLVLGTGAGLFAASIPFRFGILIAVGLWLVLTPVIYPSAEKLDEASPRRVARRRSDAGRWREAPVAEIDKSTFGKLLASRLRRDPGLHVVVRNGSAPICSDVLYDPEIDG